MDLWNLLADLHPKLVHFPLVLLPAGLLFDLFGLLGRSDRCHFAGRVLTTAGTVMLLFTFICGIYAEVWAGRALVPHHPIELHELVANVASWGFVVLAAWRLLLDVRRRGAAAAYVTLGLGWYVLLTMTAYLGGKLVTDYGAAVTGARAAGAPSLHDLNILAARQTDLNLRYSEMMHHIFGYLTLALAGSLLAAAAFPRHGRKLKWVGPTLLLLGGVFLFFFADLDLYRLTDPRQWRDREVQLHKTIALIMAVVGAAGLRQARRALSPSPLYPGERAGVRGSPPIPQSLNPPIPQPEVGPSPHPSPPSTGERGSAWTRNQAKLVAVMALIGGGMLFTHVHTVAPYANVAAGVYVAHVAMGLVALGVGASALLGDALPRWRRAFAALFALFMLAESVLLLSYNEGLPWYVGYGRYNRWGPGGGTVAPYGPVRAELTFDDARQTLAVRVLDRHRDEPAPVDAEAVDVLVARGYQETAVRLPRVDGSASHFAGTAPFLKGVPAFSARMALPVGRGGRPKMGYFDPWVTPVVAAVPPNEVARFECPMHAGVRAASGGSCPLCKMPLAPVDGGPRDGLHDAGYSADLNVETREPPLGVTLNLTPRRDGVVLADLARVHEYFMHLIVVSEDLSFFDHVHPEPQPDGSFRLPYRFPRAGRYLLFADVTPRGARSQVFRLPVSVGDVPPAPSAPPALEASAAMAKPHAADPSTTVELVATPRVLTACTPAQLLFRLARAGQPANDLSPYIGAMGHCVIISQDTQTYLHSHPEQLRPPSPDYRGGPDVAFHARFPAPGRYKVWGQFKRGGEVLVADFVVDVKGPPLPAPVMEFLFGE